MKELCGLPQFLAADVYSFTLRVNIETGSSNNRDGFLLNPSLLIISWSLSHII
jgi:hypothetical protein